MGSCASKGKSRDLIIAVDRYHMDKLKLNKTGSVEEGPSEKPKLVEPEDPPYYVEEKICVEEQTICIQTSSLGDNRNTTEVTTITRDICIQTDRPMKKKKKKKHHGKKNSQEKEIEVANPPDKSKDDSSVGSSSAAATAAATATARNGQLSRTGSLTVLRRTNSRKTGSSSSRASSISIDSVESYASIDVGVDKLPGVDAPEASHACSVRLRQLVRRLEKDDLSKEDLKNNLEYAASVLESVYIDETRRLCEEDDELSEVEPDAVPSEVRDWLALTFTRSMSNMKRKGEEKPKFRSVAHAIRAGIMVDRIYRRLSSSVGIHVPPHVLIQLKHLDDWSFNVFAVNDASDGHALKFVGFTLLQKYDLITKFKINTQVLESFLFALESGYSKYRNPYHNLLHGADVAQTVHYVLSQSKLAHWLTDLEIFATIVAALIHDFEHTGTTNNFHINTGSEVALLYNDRAVLENHHISAAFRIMKEEECGIASNLSKEEYREFRTLVIDMVLATDMSFHFQQIKNMKNLLTVPENIDKSKAVSLVLHCADISHPSKDWDLHKRWTDLLLEEFFRQGDREQELGLPFSPLCDRKNTLVAESQIGNVDLHGENMANYLLQDFRTASQLLYRLCFIDFIVDPSFQVMGDMLDKILSPLHKQEQSARNIDEAISEEVFEDKVNRSSSGSSLSSRPSTPKTPLSPGGRYELKRPWVECLSHNKVNWKEKALKDAEERHLAATRAIANDAANKSNTEDSESEKKQAKETEPENETKDSTAESDKQSSAMNSDTISIRPLVKGISRKTSTTDLLTTSVSRSAFRSHEGRSETIQSEDSSEPEMIDSGCGTDDLSPSQKSPRESLTGRSKHLPQVYESSNYEQSTTESEGETNQSS